MSDEVQGEEEGAPIISLEDVRRKRQEALRNQADREAHRERVRLLREMILKGRMSSGDVLDMARLGMTVFDRQDRLPCQDKNRTTGYPEWARYHYEKETDEDWSQLSDWRRQAEEKRLSASHIRCPLSSYIYRIRPAPPCVELLRQWEEQPHYRKGSDGDGWPREQVQVQVDPEDPVLTRNIHPCQVLGRELFVSIVSPVRWHEEEHGPVEKEPDEWG